MWKCCVILPVCNPETIRVAFGPTRRCAWARLRRICIRRCDNVYLCRPSFVPCAIPSHQLVSLASWHWLRHSNISCCPRWPTVSCPHCAHWPSIRRRRYANRHSRRYEAFWGNWKRCPRIQHCARRWVSSMLFNNPLCNCSFDLLCRGWRSHSNTIDRQCGGYVGWLGGDSCRGQILSQPKRYGTTTPTTTNG